MLSQPRQEIYPGRAEYSVRFWRSSTCKDFFVLSMKSSALLMEDVQLSLTLSVVLMLSRSNSGRSVICYESESVQIRASNEGNRANFNPE